MKLVPHHLDQHFHVPVIKPIKALVKHLCCRAQPKRQIREAKIKISKGLKNADTHKYIQACIA